jgi:protein-tyrosine-phosphatase
MALSHTVLFLCTGNYYRSRFAEVLFNTRAAHMGLTWWAESRGLALERGVHNIGPMSAAALRRLHALGIAPAAYLRLPLPLVEGDLRRAGLIVALKEAEHRPLLVERFPGWADRVRFWHVHDVDAGTIEDALVGIEREVEALAGELRAIHGRDARC